MLHMLMAILVLLQAASLKYILLNLNSGNIPHNDGQKNRRTHRITDSYDVLRRHDRHDIHDIHDRHDIHDMHDIHDSHDIHDNT